MLTKCILKIEFILYLVRMLYRYRVKKEMFRLGNSLYLFFCIFSFVFSSYSHGDVSKEEKISRWKKEFMDITINEPSTYNLFYYIDYPEKSKILSAKNVVIDEYVAIDTQIALSKFTKGELFTLTKEMKIKSYYLGGDKELDSLLYAAENKNYSLEILENGNLFLLSVSINNAELKEEKLIAKFVFYNLNLDYNDVSQVRKDFGVNEEISDGHIFTNGDSLVPQRPGNWKEKVVLFINAKKLYIVLLKKFGPHGSAPFFEPEYKWLDSKIRPKGPEDLVREEAARLEAGKLAQFKEGLNLYLAGSNPKFRQQLMFLLRSKDSGLAKQVLETAEEPVNSRRWFLLQSAKATTLFQTDAWNNRAFEAYDAIFDAADQAANNDALYLLHASIGEYVQMAATRFRKLNLDANPRTQTTLLKAWDAYLKTPLPLSGFMPAPDFAGAFAALQLNDKALGLVEKALADPQGARSYTLLSTGAALVAPQEPERAIALLGEAKTKLPMRPAKVGDKVVQTLDVNEAARLYDRLGELFLASKQTDQAIATQRERVTKTNGGRGVLWLLLKRAGRDAEAATVARELEQPDARETEVLRAVRAWGEVPKSEVLYETARTARIALLENYLTIQRPRDVAHDLEARVILGRHYQREKAWEKLRSLVALEKPKSLSAQNQVLWSALEKLKSRLPKSTEATTPAF